MLLKIDNFLSFILIIMSELLKNPELEAGTQLSSQEKNLLRTDGKRKNFVEKAVNDVNAKYPKNPLLDWHRQQAKNLETIQEKQQKAREEKIDAKRRNDPFYGKSDYEIDQLKDQMEKALDGKRINLSEAKIPNSFLENYLNKYPDKIIYLKGNLTDEQCKILASHKNHLNIKNIKLSDKQTEMLSQSSLEFLELSPIDLTNKQAELLSHYAWYKLYISLSQTTNEQLRLLSTNKNIELTLTQLNPHNVEILANFTGNLNFSFKEINPELVRQLSETKFDNLHFAKSSLTDEEAKIISSLSCPISSSISLWAQSLTWEQIKILSQSKAKTIYLYHLKKVEAGKDLSNLELLLNPPFSIDLGMREHIKKVFDK